MRFDCGEAGFTFEAAGEGGLFWVLLVFFGVVAAGWVGWPYFKIWRLQGRYEAVLRGMTEVDVRRVMGDGVLGERKIPESDFYWENVRLSDVEAARIEYSVGWTVGTWFVPVTFDFAFDGAGILVGKHRF